MALRGTLHLDEVAGVVHHDVHIGLSLGILVVVEIQHHLTVDHAHGDGGDGAPQRRAVQCTPAHQAGERITVERAGLNEAANLAGQKLDRVGAGIDLDAEYGTVIHASAGGWVSSAQWHVGHGRRVVVDGRETELVEGSTLERCSVGVAGDLPLDVSGALADREDAAAQALFADIADAQQLRSDLARDFLIAVIEAAVRALPPEYIALDGARLRADLRGRRDRLTEAGRRFYKHLAGAVDVQATDAAEQVHAARNTHLQDFLLKSGTGLADFLESGGNNHHGAGARLERALIQFMLDLHVNEHGYTETWPPALANRATRFGAEAGTFRVHAPLLSMTKAQIVLEAVRLGVDPALTLSCYAPIGDGRPCGECDACRLRAKGFREAGLRDPGL